MTQHSSASPSDGTDRVLCYYINATSQLQMARITHLASGCFERLIFPGQRLLFEAPPDALLEIHSSKATNTSLLAQIPCQQLRVYEKLASSDRTHVVERL
ncbi:DUF1830 domain-containing protein [Phormidesmis priestleyi ULC007]|uniref:DUF1830 domain-containing protein n=1 Tax=Phormidesmis priestleyi ULC007 TaxID=1920490 RepID=A0A2T1DIL7_9CYAN|nr:DUF1830 domain-containing protein [Phormidesmis priestleyi]PSB20305.1 DUF1830 domain-containing protein [Phormidesmis priestleyi ULC007]PZO50174.1 MAG: DUF1830 domain-containing protein [Phormidesmis priestleyi]